MCDRNDKSECILINVASSTACTCFESICERTTKFHEKILFDSGVINLINLQTPTTNISVSDTALLTAVTCPKVTLCCENPFDVLAIGDGVGCCEESGTY